MKFIEDLMQGEAVQWKPLGEVAEYEQPTKYLVVSSTYKENSSTPVLTAGKTFILGYTDEQEGVYPASVSPVIIFDDFTTDNKWVDFDFKIKSSAMKLITSKDEDAVLLKYIYYWLNTLPSEAKEQGLKRQWISNFSKKLIPIPPLRVQRKIVEILDNFAELTAELTARKKQYEYYRNKLLSFEGFAGAITYKPLGEVLIRTRGTNITAGQMKLLHKDGGDIKIFGGGKTVVYVNREDIPISNIQVEPSVIVKSRGIVEFEYYDKPFSHKNELWAYHSKNSEIDIKFVFYYLKLNEPYFQNIANRMQMPQIAIPDTDKFLIPIPPLEEQRRIVDILDKFDTLVNSLTEGLPREIELRRKQYEYYRNKLLAFPQV